MKQTAPELYEKLVRLEQELNRLKVETYFTLPQQKRISLYPQKVIQKAVKETRNAIWQERYAKKIARIS